MKSLCLLLICLTLGLLAHSSNFPTGHPTGYMHKTQRPSGYFTDPLYLNETFYSGFLSNGDSDTFYWLFASRKNPSNDPLLVWLTGGPGCSSEIAVFYENGPYRFSKSWPDQLLLDTNPYSWNNVANILYLDTPRGVGYAKNQGFDQSEDQAVTDIYNVLVQFYSVYPSFKGRDLYIGGSSYTAHYIANIGERIVQNHPAGISLKGVLLGNAWIDAYNQYASHAQFAFNSGLITQAQFLVLRAGFETCRLAIKNGLLAQAVTACQGTMNELIGNPPKFNYYNINSTTCVAPICYNFTEADALLKTNTSQLILGVRGLPWTECNDTATSSTNFTQSRLISSSNHVAALLENGVQVLAYNGELDLMANWISGEYWTTNVTWSGQQNFVNSTYKVNGDYGEFKQYGNLIYYRIHGAGHLTNIEQPEASLDMFVKFINGWNHNGEGEKKTPMTIDL